MLCLSTPANIELANARRKTSRVERWTTGLTKHCDPRRALVLETHAEIDGDSGAGDSGARVLERASPQICPGSPAPKHRIRKRSDASLERERVWQQLTSPSDRHARCFIEPHHQRKRSSSLGWRRRALVDEYGWGSCSIASPTLRVREETTDDSTGKPTTRVSLEIADVLTTSFSRTEDGWGGWRDIFVIMRSAGSARFSDGAPAKRDEVIFRSISLTSAGENGSASGKESVGSRSEELSRSGSEAAVHELLRVAAGRMGIRNGLSLVGSLGDLTNTSSLVGIAIDSLRRLAGTCSLMDDGARTASQDLLHGGAMASASAD